MLPQRLAQLCEACVPLLELRASEGAGEDTEHSSDASVTLPGVPGRIADLGIDLLKAWAALPWLLPAEAPPAQLAAWLRTTWLPSHRAALAAADFLGCSAFLELSALAGLLFLRDAGDEVVTGLLAGRWPSPSLQFGEQVRGRWRAGGRQLSCTR